ncbi:TPA: DUF4942 domain-containing protein [Acinetobacter baumannii]|nr:DUF4942 domain-containing protein [Acinetobacter baumannii]
MNAPVIYNNEIIYSEHTLDFSLVEKMICDYEVAKTEIRNILNSVKAIELQNVEIIKALGLISNSYSFNKEEDALRRISSFFWKKLVDSLEIHNFMAEKEYDELSGQIAKNEIEEFSKESVTNFVNDLWNRRHIVFARKIDSIFSLKSNKYRNNLGALINPYLVIHAKYRARYVIQKQLDDVRFACRQLFGYSLNFTKAAELKNNYGQWQSVDHNLLRLKFYENGNCHIWFNVKVVERLNQVLNLLYPDQLGSSDQMKVKRRGFEEELEQI